MKKKEFESREFEGETDSLFTFQGHNGMFCIMLNAKCVHSCKTLKSHEKELERLINEKNLIEI